MPTQPTKETNQETKTIRNLSAENRVADLEKIRSTTFKNLRLNCESELPKFYTRCQFYRDDDPRPNTKVFIPNATCKLT